MEVTRWSVVTLGSNDLPTDWKDYNFSDLFSQEEASILITTEHVFIMLSIMLCINIMYYVAVCEEQDMRRPSQPGVSEAVLTGLIGKSCTKHRKQIFIIMVEFMGSFIPVAMAWLADKSALSYYSCLAMLLIAFRGKRDEIQSLYRRSTLRLRQIKCDFEAAIHLGWGLFTISGCYFH